MRVRINHKLRPRSSQGMALLEMSLTLMLVVPFVIATYGFISYLNMVREVDQTVTRALDRLDTNSVHLLSGNTDMWVRADHLDLWNRLQEVGLELAVEFRRITGHDTRYFGEVGFASYQMSPLTGKAAHFANANNTWGDDEPLVNLPPGLSRSVLAVPFGVNHFSHYNQDFQVFIDSSFAPVGFEQADVVDSEFFLGAVPSAIKGLRRREDLGTSNIYRTRTNVGTSDPHNKSNYLRSSTIIALQVHVDFSHTVWGRIISAVGFQPHMQRRRVIHPRLVF